LLSTRTRPLKRAVGGERVCVSPEAIVDVTADTVTIQADTLSTGMSGYSTRNGDA